MKDKKAREDIYRLIYSNGGAYKGVSRLTCDVATLDREIDHLRTINKVLTSKINLLYKHFKLEEVEQPSRKYLKKGK